MASHCAAARTAITAVCSKKSGGRSTTCLFSPPSSLIVKNQQLALLVRQSSSCATGATTATTAGPTIQEQALPRSTSNGEEESRSTNSSHCRGHHHVANSPFARTSLGSRTSFLTVSFGGQARLQSIQQQQQQQQSRLFSSSSSGGGGKRDFYKVLGVDRNADKGAIKKAYFKLAKQYHPDTNKGDDKTAEKFREVTEAYEILSDDKQREMYSQFGHAGVDPNFQAAGGGGNPFGGAGGFNFQDGSFHFSSSTGGNPEIDPEELFDMFFGGGGGGRQRRARGPRRGADLQMHVRLSFKEAVFGAKKDLNLRYQHVNRQTGEVSVKEREVQVDVPAGVDNGMNLRLQGQGAEGDPGAQPGNLLVQLIVDQDDFFERDGYDVHCEVPISLTQAVLGGMVDVKTLDNTVEMKIPKGCQPDTKLMLRGKGIKQLHGSTKGNQIVHLKIVIPKEITARQEALLREFDDETAKCGNGIFGNLSAAAGSAFEKLFGTKKKDTKKDSSTSSSAAEDSEDDEKKQAAS